MSRQQRLISLPLVGAALLGLLVGGFFFAWKRLSKSAPRANIRKHTVKTSPDESLAYWTADRMRQSKPAPMPHIESSETLHSKKHPSRPTDSPEAE